MPDTTNPPEKKPKFHFPKHGNLCCPGTLHKGGQLVYSISFIYQLIHFQIKLHIISNTNKGPTLNCKLLWKKHQPGIVTP